MVRIASITTFPDKLHIVWKGPYVVKVVIGDNVYTVVDGFGKSQTVHSFRMMYYDGRAFKWAEAIKSNYIHMTGRYEVEQIMELRKLSDKIEALVKWKGFKDSSATWEPVEVLLQDVPKIMMDYLNSAEEDDILSAEIMAEMVNHEAKWIVQKYPSDMEMEEDIVEFCLSHNKGWCISEDEILEQAVRIFGYGNWNAIIKENLLPGKTRAQIISRVQKKISCQRIEVII